MIIKSITNIHDNHDDNYFKNITNNKDNNNYSNDENTKGLYSVFFLSMLLQSQFFPFVLSF